MGILIHFYTGDTARIVSAWKDGGLDQPAQKGHVLAQADLSFHLSDEDLDRLVHCACRLRGQTPVTFMDCVASDLAVEPAHHPESGIHEMSEAFRDLFAAIPAEQAAVLEAQWCTAMQEAAASEAPRQAADPAWLSKLKRGMGAALMGLVLIPMLWACWLLSPRLRRERKQNRMKNLARQSEQRAVPEDTLADAVAALIHTCGTAKAHGRQVFYTWSL